MMSLSGQMVAPKIAPEWRDSSVFQASRMRSRHLYRQHGEIHRTTRQSSRDPTKESR